MDIKIPLLAHQIKAVEAKTKFVALTGGYGSGKSTTCAFLGISHTMVDPGILHAIISPSYPQAKLTIIPAVFEVLEDWMGFKEGKDFEYNRSDHMFRMQRWGGQLVILSGENPKRLKGPNLGSCGMDEPGIMQYSVFKQAIGRVRHPKAKLRQIYLCGTPEDMNWYADVVEGDLKPSDLTDIRARTRDNIFLSEDFFSTMEESYNEQELKAYMEGQFVNLNASQAYHGYSTANIIERAEFGNPDPSLPLLLGFDYNWSPNTAIVAQEVPDWCEHSNSEPRRKLVVFDEFYLNNCSTTSKCEQIIDRYGSAFEYLIYQDATGKNDNARTVGVSDLNLVNNAFNQAKAKHRVYSDNVNPRRIDRLNACNGRMNNGKGEKFIFITRNCKKLVEDFRKCTREEFLAGRYKDATLGHISDAFGYMISYRYPIRRKIKHSNRKVVQ